MKNKKKYRRIPIKTFLGLLICGAFVISLWFFLFSTKKHEKGPKPILWGKHICAQCGMHIDDPRFAAQVQIQKNKKDEVLFFDDTGCLVEYLHQKNVNEETQVKAMYFQHTKKSQWIREEEAEFVLMNSLSSPMGYNFGIFEKGENPKASKAMDFTEMKEKILNSPNKSE